MGIGHRSRCGRLIATVFSFLGSLGWFLDLFSHFRVQYFLGLSVVALLLLIPRQRKASVCFSVFAVVNLCSILPLYWNRSEETSPTVTVYRAILINVNTQFGDVDRVTETIASIIRISSFSRRLVPYNSC